MRVNKVTYFLIIGKNGDFFYHVIKEHNTKEEDILMKMTSVNHNTAKPRPMRCPVCPAGRIIDLAPNMDASRVMLYGPQDSDKAMFFCKCSRCKSQIGVALKVS